MENIVAYSKINNLTFKFLQNIWMKTGGSPPLKDMNVCVKFQNGLLLPYLGRNHFNYFILPTETY